MGYKHGDKVKIVDNLVFHGFEDGEVVEIIAFHGENCYAAKSIRTGESWGIYKDDCEPIKD